MKAKSPAGTRAPDEAGADDIGETSSAKYSQRRILSPEQHIRAVMAFVEAVAKSQAPVSPYTRRLMVRTKLAGERGQYEWFIYCLAKTLQALDVEYAHNHGLSWDEYIDMGRPRPIEEVQTNEPD